MMRNRRPTWLLTALLTALIAGLAVGGLALAGKPPKGGSGGGSVPLGTIYFLNVDLDVCLSMRGDGSVKTLSACDEPSYQTHDGTRWFLTRLYVTDLDGTRHAELFAVTEDGLTLQLTDDPTVTPSWYFFRWAKDDSFLSYVGVIHAADGSQETALFVADVDWSLGLPVIALPQPILYGDILAHDWSPFGDEVVYTRPSEAYGHYLLEVTTFFADGSTFTHSLSEGRNPEWSPDGRRIAFDRGEIWTILPDGTGAVQLTKATLDGGGENQQDGPTWSPDGKFLAFTENIHKQKGFQPTVYSYNVLRISADGGKTTNLTDDIGNSGGPRWRP